METWSKKIKNLIENNTNKSSFILRKKIDRHNNVFRERDSIYSTYLMTQINNRDKRNLDS